MRLAVLSTGRQDWGIVRSVARWASSSPGMELTLLAGGMACERRFGNVADAMAAEGFSPVRLPWLTGAPEGEPIHAEMARALAALGDALARERPDALLLVGDRYETLAAATAATLALVPVVHLHGGEETEGAFDNAFRHAITKLSHLHLVSHPEHARRVIAMGEDPEAVHVVGAPGLDNLTRGDLADRQELEAYLGRPLPAPLVVVTFHPTTLGGAPEAEVEELVAAMATLDASYVVTLPNSDPGNAAIRSALVAATTGFPRRVSVEALGERRYWGLLRLADAVLGNSSSAIIEAPVLGVPAVNVGDRQKGRVRGGNTIDVPAERGAIARALGEALSPDFRAKARAAPSPFGDGHASEAIGAVLRTWTPPRPPIKRLYAP